MIAAAVAKVSRVEFSNYRALRSVSLDLGDFTVLVGPNACGKSSVLAGLTAPLLLADRSAGSDASPMIVLELDDGTAIRKDPTVGQSPRGSSFHFDLAALRASTSVMQVHGLDASGANLVNVFASLGRRQQEALVEEFTELVPVFGDVNALPHSPGTHRLAFEDRWTASRQYDAAEVSDGSLLVLAYLVLHYQTNAVQLACIEEPERGLHPWLLAKMIDLLRKMSRGDVGDRRTQIVIATQSSDVLNHVEPEEVRFFARDPESGLVTITRAPTERPEWVRTLHAYENSLGALWLSGSVGGVPAE